MKDSDTSAMRIVAGGELHLRRKSKHDRWEIVFFERVVNLATALSAGVLQSERLAGHHFEGQTFATPEEAAEAVARLVTA
jgi:hypothetical protein